MTYQIENDGLDDARETWEMMRIFLKENIEQWTKVGWTKEEATEHSLFLLNGLMGDKPLRDEEAQEVLGDS